MKLSTLIKTTSDIIKKVSRNHMQEAELLICYALSKPKTYLIKQKNLDITKNITEKILNLAKKRTTDTPLAYLTKKKFFYNNEFIVSKNTLIPRPETELLVDQAIKEINNRLLVNNQKKLNILEIGTGTGCIPISIIKTIIKKIQLSSFNISIYSTEISTKAIEICKKNSKKLLPNFNINYNKKNYFSQKKEISKYKKISFSVIHANITLPNNLTKLPISLKDKKFDLIISNPPYIPSNKMKKLPKSVKKEPAIALDGGEKGLEITKKIIVQTKSLLNTNACLLLEGSSTKLSLIKNHIQKFLGKNVKIKFIKDLTRRIRFIKIDI